MALKLSKVKTVFRCQECGYSAAKWLGKCPDCGRWNSLVEERQADSPASGRGMLTDFSSSVKLISEVSAERHERSRTGIVEFDRMIGGGLVKGSLVLLGGSPGIGKSTLMLQVASRLSKDKKVLYVSGEESQEQVKARADRLGLQSPNLYLHSETNLENIIESVKSADPEFLVIDSIQTTFRPDVGSSAGSVAQVRECAAEFLRLAKSRNLTTFLLGHVTKEGDLAGPRVLEHIVDTVLYFESEKHQVYRVLRAYKNRFGPTSEIGLFEMGSAGLEEVSNPSKFFLSEHRRGAGSMLVPAVEGTRAILLEVQALVSRTPFGMPRRQATGFDYNRAVLMVAVLENRVGMNFQNHDVFVNVAGGARIAEPAADLGVVCAMASAMENFSIESDGVLIGEVGLGGELRGVSHLRERLKEAEKLGMKWAIVPKRSLKEKFPSETMKVVSAETVQEVVGWMRKASHSQS